MSTITEDVLLKKHELPKKKSTNTPIVLALMAYNALVVICTLLGVYFISGWMFFLLMALMKLSSEDKDE